MRIAIVRTMPNFSMDVHADGIVAGLKTVRPNWEIVEVAPTPVDRHSRSWRLRLYKFYERFWSFPNQVKQQAANADIVHIIDHSEGHIVRWVKQTNAHVVVTCHDLINALYQGNLKGSVKVPFLSNGLWMYSVRSMRKSDRIISVSATTAKDITRILQIEPSRIDVVPNAVEGIFQPLSDEQIATIRQRLGVPPDHLCLLNVGSNHPRKNLSTILDSITQLHQKGVAVKLLKVGADFTTEQQQWIQNQGLEQVVDYLGNPDKSTLVEIYNAADILIAPSLHEGFGMTLLESMACGTPVITSNVSAMPEVVEDAGVLINPTNVDELAAAILQLRHDSERYQDFVQRGLTRAKAFTWEIVAEQIAQAYERLPKSVVKAVVTV
jgi:glycosyltransferase involved in cell wall biosynthesis